MTPSWPRRASSGSRRSRAPSAPRATSDAPRSLGRAAPRPAPAARPRSPRFSCRERLLDRAVYLLRAGLAEDVPGHPPVRGDDERPWNRKPAVLPEHAPVGIAHVRVRDPVTVEEAARVRRVVRRVDPDEGHAVAVALERGLKPRRLALARVAPGGPEVDDHDLAAQRRELERAVAVQAPEIEVD